MNVPSKVKILSRILGVAAPKAGNIAPMSIGFLLFDGFQPIDLAGPWQAFSTANEELGRAAYLLTTIGTDIVATTWDQGLRVHISCNLAESATTPLDVLIVPGGAGVYKAMQNNVLLEWVRDKDRSTHRTCSICTGAFLLAAAGLLNDRKVTTHWRSAARLQQEFPRLSVNDEMIYCESGKYWTTAGVSAGIDLALALIERDLGLELSQRVARRLVVYLRRSGDQRQYSQTLRLQDRASAPFSELIGQLEMRLDRVWSIDDMAHTCGMSRRTFQRKFLLHFGVPPTEALSALRREHAEILAHSGKLSHKEIARRVGLTEYRPVRSQGSVSGEQVLVTP